MKTPIWFLLALALVVGAVLWLLFGQSSDSGLPDETLTASPLPSEAPTPTPLPEIRFPVPTPEAAPEDPLVPTPTPLPSLGESDPAFRGALVQRYGSSPLERWLAPNALIQRIVVTVDSLDQPTPITLRSRPIAHVPGLFVVVGEGDTLTTNEDNARRYTPYVQLLQSVPAGRVAELYFGFYPLFQAAYEELGYPGRHFNDRLVDVIDHLLETPELPQPVALVRPKVLYQYADADTEARSWGQKLLIRMGLTHLRAVKAELRAFRAAVTQMPLEPLDLSAPEADPAADDADAASPLP
jgi:hypothetical protein